MKIARCFTCYDIVLHGLYEKGYSFLHREFSVDNWDCPNEGTQDNTSGGIVIISTNEAKKNNQVHNTTKTQQGR